MTKAFFSLRISGTVPHIIAGFWYTCAKLWYLQQFFPFFQKSDFTAFQSSINKCQKDILRCSPPSCLTWVWLFLLNYDLFRPSWSYQGQNYQNVPQISQRNIVPLVLIYCLILWSPICTPLIFVSVSAKMAGTSVTVTYNSMRVYTPDELLI